MIEYSRAKALSGLQNKIGYKFSDISLLDTALTHTSFVKGEGKAVEHNERLEYLGDAVLELSVSANIFKNYPSLNEGRMTKVRALTVCEDALYNIALVYDIGNMLQLSRGEENSGGRKKPSILADAVEALIGAIYIDGGFDEANAFITKAVSSNIADAVSGVSVKDYKTALQELVQRERLGTLEYVLISTSGPDHKKEFEMQVLIDGNIYGSGMGYSKQEASQCAAGAALNVLERGGKDKK